MSNPLLGKVFDLPNLTSYQKIILWQIIYDEDVYRDQLAEKASCSPKTVTESLKLFKRLNFLYNYDTSTRKKYSFVVNRTEIEIAWANRLSTAKKPKGKRKGKNDSHDLHANAKLESPVPQNLTEETCLETSTREPRSFSEGAPFPNLGSPVPTPIYEYMNNKINKLNIDPKAETNPEPEHIYLFSCDNNVSEKEDNCVIEDHQSEHTFVSYEADKKEEAKQNVIIIAEQLTSHASNMANLSPKMQVIISKIQDMRRNGIIPANIGSKTDQTLSAEAAIHVKDQIAKGFTFDQGLKSFENLVKKGLFQTPNSMQKHANEHARIKTEKENLKKSLTTDEINLKICSEDKLHKTKDRIIKAEINIAIAQNSLGNAYQLIEENSFLVPYLEKEGLRYKWKGSEEVVDKVIDEFQNKEELKQGAFKDVSNIFANTFAKNDEYVSPNFTNKTFIKPTQYRKIDSSGDEQKRKLLEEQMKEFARLNPGSIAL